MCCTEPSAATCVRLSHSGATAYGHFVVGKFEYMRREPADMARLRVPEGTPRATRVYPQQPTNLESAGARAATCPTRRKDMSPSIASASSHHGPRPPAVRPQRRPHRHRHLGILQAQERRETRARAPSRPTHRPTPWQSSYLSHLRRPLHVRPRSRALISTS